MTQAGASEVPGIPGIACALWVRQSPIHPVNSATLQSSPLMLGTHRHTQHISQGASGLWFLCWSCSAGTIVSWGDCPQDIL